MASSAEPADVYNRPASLDSQFRIRSMDGQIRRTRGTNSQIGRECLDGLKRRASLDGVTSAQIGNAAVIRYPLRQQEEFATYAVCSPRAAYAIVHLNN